jgi:hypothetical protein
MRLFFPAGRSLAVPALVLILLGGCATLPATRPLADDAQRKAAAVFLQTMEERESCLCCLDAQVRLTVRSMFANGAIPGFLQARSPSFLRFVGLNPLDQPLVIAATDGSSFRSLVVPEGKAYEGPVTAAAFSRYVPAGFVPGHGFFWLTGSLFPGDLRILAVREDADGQGYWLVVAHGDEEFRRHILFDAQKRLLLRHIVLDARGTIVMAVRYGQYQEVVAPGGGLCSLPGTVRMEAGLQGRSVLEMTMSDWLPEVVFAAEDFTLALPPGFAVIPVE